ncbi:unnamed protein product [Mytilus coruscus]|uniref:HAT C-terminal dimerisation domain-containing protein n=1 Tax=Mytilus coruscus TaxID=42192 RepID=A0A6J8BJ87_MYTCO|nr:unnamed protein product [Mytilus coruscus]
MASEADDQERFLPVSNDDAMSLTVNITDKETCKDSPGSLTESSVSDAQSDQIATNSKDGRKFCSFKYDSRYPWAYHNVVKDGFICKYCELFPAHHDNCLEFVNVGVKFGTHPSRKLEKHDKSFKHQFSEIHKVCSESPQRRMRHISPKSVYINCRNHKLALCLKHLTKDYPLLLELDKALLSLWKMFEYSPLKSAVFQNIQETYGQKTYAIVKASMTRCLSHLHACNRLIERYDSIIDTLDTLYDDLKEPEILGLRQIIMRKNMIGMALILCDILKPVNVLNLYLQVFSKIDNICDMVNERTVLARRLRGDQNDGFTIDGFIRDVGVPFIFSLMNEIQDAFHASPLLNAFGAIDPRNLPENLQELPEHGEVSPPDFNSSLVVEGELRAYRQQLFMMRQRGCTSMSSILREFESDNILKASFPHVYQLVYYSLCIPVSTAVVERTFSLMNNICTPERNRPWNSHR